MDAITTSAVLMLLRQPGAAIVIDPDVPAGMLKMADVVWPGVVRVHDETAARQLRQVITAAAELGGVVDLVPSVEQLVREDPDGAAEVLREMGYAVSAPDGAA